MRIAFLFDNSPGHPETLDLVAHAWINGLAESQHEIKVITQQNCLPPAGLSGRVSWAQAMRTWSWLEFPRLVQTLMPFSPQLIHGILCRPLRSTQVWSMAAALKAWRIPFVVSAGDGVLGPERWPYVSAELTPSQVALTLPPISPTPVSFPQPIDIFVPGPLKVHQDWRRSVRQILAEAPRQSSQTWWLGWDWSEIPLPERLSWRQEIAQLEPQQMRSLGALTPQEQLAWARSARIVRLDMLAQKTWMSQFLRQNREPADKNLLDASINQLTRTYMSVLAR